MRTLEEVIEHVQRLRQEIENGDPAARHKGPNCPGCLYELLEFINSDPPCKHPEVFWRPELQAGLTSFPPGWWLHGRGETMMGMVNYCPDCGQKLEDSCEVSKK